MLKKQKKTKEERSSEEFFPIDQDDIKRTIEKKIKEPPQERGVIAKSIIEKKYKKPLRGEQIVSDEKTRRPRKSSFKRKPFKKISRAKKVLKEYKPQKIDLKKLGYELIITEKPQAALKISSALGKSTKRNDKGIPYYEVDRDGKKIVVACAVGHLFTLHQKVRGSGFPVFDISWEPNYIVRKTDFTKKYFDTLLRLAKSAGEITVATDYDIEGEVIGLNVIRYICGQEDAARMKFSTLTDKELNDAYVSKSKVINWGQAIAGETRHYLDWFYGINLSRAIMSAIKATGRFKIMSIGRVQGPTLHLIVKKEKEIKSFKSVPYWQVFITVKNSEILELKYNKDIFNESELKQFEGLKGKEALASTEKKTESLPPGVPFNLTNLQTEAYKFYGITPSATLKAAQSLYLAGLISYPRTSSQKLPSAIDYKEILKTMAKKYKVEKLIKKDTPLEGKKSDPAHPSIYPTGNFQILSGDEEKIYELIVRRFLCLFCEDAMINRKKVTAEINSLKFSTNGSEVIKKAWMEIYPSKMKEIQIPDLEGPVKITNVKTEAKETQPPRRYSPASIISELEKKNLGTKATRSSILETLYDRGYIKEKSIEATPLGISLIDTLEKYSPIIIDEKLTRSFENSMESIVEATKEFTTKKDKIIEKAKKTITLIAKDFEKNEKLIGNELVNASDEMREQLREENTLNSCPVCEKGNLIINYSKKTRRYFVACNSYPKCTNTYSLPPNGIIKRTQKTCEECGWPILMRISKGKRPWEFCFNPECKTNKERIAEYNRKKQEENN